MIDFASDRTLPSRPRGAFPAAVADAAGVLWGHSNPVELYRWVALRNELLETIAVASSLVGPVSRRPSAAG